MGRLDAPSAIGSLMRRSTSMLVLSELYAGKVPRAPRLFAAALVYAALGIYVADRIFPMAVGTVSIFLAVFALLPTATLLVERSKIRQGTTALRANLRLARTTLAIFLGTMLSFSLAGLWWSTPELNARFSLQLAPWAHLAEPNYSPASFFHIIGNNLLVLLATCALACVYRIAGALLVLCWNASTWGLVFVHFARWGGQGTFVAAKQYVVMIACILPHIACEALGYIVAAMAGIVIVRRLVRGEEALAQMIPLVTWKEAAGLVAAAVGCVVIGAVLEVTLAPTLLAALR